MMQKYINHLIDKIPDQYITKLKDPTNKPLRVDIIFEAGLFNGSYQLGFLSYIKQMEKNQLLKVERVSGSSVGSIIAFLYFTNLSINDSINFISNVIYKHVKKYYNIDIFKKFFDFCSKQLPNNFLDIINGKLFITYNDISKGKQIVKSSYSSIDELFDVIQRSCYIPYVIDKSFFYKGKYIDGLYPYIFKPKKNRKIIYVNVINVKKISSFISIRNEKNNMRRVIDGIIDTHTFFSSNFCSNMCSYIDDRPIIAKLQYFILIKFYQVSVLVLHYFYVLNKLSKKLIKTNYDIKKMVHILYTFLFKSICI
jgi:predicted acylesterase/phospholipase RssA